LCGLRTDLPCSSSCSGAVYFNDVLCSVVSYRFVMSSVFQHCLCGLCTHLVHTVVLHILRACCLLWSPHWFVMFSVFLHCLCALCTLLVHTMVLHILTAFCGLWSQHWFVMSSVFCLCGIHTDLQCSRSCSGAVYFNGMLCSVVSALICDVLCILTVFVRSLCCSSSYCGTVYFYSVLWTVVSALICDVLCILTLFVRSSHRFAMF